MPLSKLCALDSQESGQMIIGTATGEKTLWLVLEYNRSWTARATIENDLPAGVQNWLSQQEARLPQLRVAFIKQNGVATGRKRLFVAVAGELERRLYRFELQRYQELTRLDLEAIVQTPGDYQNHLIDHPLFLVCTNGKRDRCCAKFGLPVYQELARRAAHPEAVWQCTHIGGHRYAPVVATLPAGGIYRLLAAKTQGPELVATTTEGRLWLDGLRGRSCYSPAVQAAEYYVRRHIQRDDLDALEVKEVVSNGATGRVTVHFAEPATEQSHLVELAERQTGPLLASCSPEKFKPQPSFELISCRLFVPAAD